MCTTAKNEDHPGWPLPLAGWLVNTALNRDAHSSQRDAYNYAHGGYLALELRQRTIANNTTAATTGKLSNPLPSSPPNRSPLCYTTRTQSTRRTRSTRAYTRAARGVLSGLVGVGVEVQRDPRLRGPCGRAGLLLGLVLQGGEGQRQGHYLLRSRGVEPHCGPGAVSPP